MGLGDILLHSKNLVIVLAVEDVSGNFCLLLGERLRWGRFRKFYFGFLGYFIFILGSLGSCLFDLVESLEQGLRLIGLMQLYRLHEKSLCFIEISLIYGLLGLRETLGSLVCVH